MQSVDTYLGKILVPRYSLLSCIISVVIYVGDERKVVCESAFLEVLCLVIIMGDEREVIGKTALLKILSFTIIVSDEWEVVCESAFLKIFCVVLMCNKGKIVSESTPLETTGLDYGFNRFIVLMADLGSHSKYSKTIGQAVATHTKGKS